MQTNTPVQFVSAHIYASNYLLHHTVSHNLKDFDPSRQNPFLYQYRREPGLRAIHSPSHRKLYGCKATSTSVTATTGLK